MSMTKKRRNDSLRPFLLTLTRADIGKRGKVHKEEILKRIIKSFRCTSVLVVKGFWHRMPRFLKTYLLYLLFCFLNAVLFSCLGIKIPFPSFIVRSLCDDSDNEDENGNWLAQPLQVEDAPHPLRERVKRELCVLFNIGYERQRKESFISDMKDTLAIDTSSEEFLKFLLERIEELQKEHFNWGQHRKFAFTTKAQKERLYSVLWEFSRGRNND